MTHSTENKLVKQVNQFGWGNLITIIGMAGCCFIYADTKYSKIMDKLNNNERVNEVMSSSVADHNRRIIDIERFRQSLSTYYDKPRGIKIVIQNN